ncbi:FecR family protein [Bacteroides sp. UBA939]|uniref:FecR family protein n=1 Tax=Bacteroides sp. UBA939 TaxID=1946092 RepID=UPI0025B9E9E0|nr:FecR domain-containing protein [Bacteroides sp. UBA939]
MEDEQYMIDIDEIIGKCFSGEMTEEEKDYLMQWVNDSIENKAYFEGMRNIMHASSPAFRPEDIDVDRAMVKVIGRTAKFQKKEILLWWQRIAGVILLPLLFGAAYLWWDYNVLADEVLVTQEITSPWGTSSKVELPDGSIVWLNSGSKLRYPVNFSDNDTRQLYLTGEAFFKVQSDEKHPFIVNTKNMTVVATGTQFNVESYATDTITAVTLVEGALNVNISEKQNLRLLPNQRLVYNNLSARYNRTTTDASQWLLWKDGILAFRDEPLANVFKRIGRTFNVDIVMADEDIFRQPYRATFQDESFDKIIDLLKLTVPIKYEKEESVHFDDGSFSKFRIVVSGKK